VVDIAVELRGLEWDGIAGDLDARPLELRTELQRGRRLRRGRIVAQGDGAAGGEE